MQWPVSAGQRYSSDGLVTLSKATKTVCQVGSLKARARTTCLVPQTVTACVDKVLETIITSAN